MTENANLLATTKLETWSGLKDITYQPTDPPRSSKTSATDHSRSLPGEEQPLTNCHYPEHGPAYGPCLTKYSLPLTNLPHSLHNSRNNPHHYQRLWTITRSMKSKRSWTLSSIAEKSGT